MSDKIVLCGGPHDGLRVNAAHAANYIKAVSSAVGFENITKDVEFLYLSRRYAGCWPIANWDFFVDYDVTLDEPGSEGEAYTPWWTTTVWATKERHAEIETHFELTLNRCIGEMMNVRFYAANYGDIDGDIDSQVEMRQRDLDSALDRLYELTHNPILEEVR